jgi:hypothetical protein
MSFRTPCWSLCAADTLRLRYFSLLISSRTASRSCSTVFSRRSRNCLFRSSTRSDRWFCVESINERYSCREERSLVRWEKSEYRRYSHDRYRVERHCWRDFQTSLDSTRRLQIEGWSFCVIDWDSARDNKESMLRRRLIRVRLCCALDIMRFSEMQIEIVSTMIVKSSMTWALWLISISRSRTTRLDDMTTMKTFSSLEECSKIISLKAVAVERNTLRARRSSESKRKM